MGANCFCSSRLMIDLLGQLWYDIQSFCPAKINVVPAFLKRCFTGLNEGYLYMNGTEGTGSILGSLLPFILLIAFFFFFIIRPQRQEAKRIQNMHDSLRVGDKVETVASMVGEITLIEGEYVVVNVAEKGTCKIRMHKRAIARVFSDKEIMSMDAPADTKTSDDK